MDVSYRSQTFIRLKNHELKSWSEYPVTILNERRHNVRINEDTMRNFVTILNV